MATEILSKQIKVGLIQQSKTANHWTAPASASAAFENQYYIAGVTLPKDSVTRDQANVINSSSGVMKEEARAKINAVSGLKTMPFEGYITKETWAKHLVACFQAVTEGVTTPYTKQFAPADSALDWNNNEGYLFSVCYYPLATYGSILENALLDDYKIMINPMATGIDRFLKHSGTWIGNKLTHNQTISGTWTNPAANTLYNTATTPFETDLNLVIGGTTLTDICFKNFEMTWKANIANRCATIGGKANNYNWSPTLNILIDLEYTSATAALIDAYRAGSNCYISAFTDTVATTSDGGVLIATEKGELTTDVSRYEGEYLAVRLEFEVHRPVAGWGKIITMADAIDGGY